MEIPKYLHTLAPDLVMRKAPVSLRNPMAFTFSSLVMRAAGLPTRATLCSISASSRSETFWVMGSGVFSACWRAGAVNCRRFSSMASIRVMS